MVAPAFHASVTLPNGKAYDQPTGLFINNEWVAGSDAQIETFDPYTGKLIATVEGASAEDVDKAVDAAEKAKKAWRDTAPADRAVILNRMADLIERDADLIASIDVGVSTGL
jgi:aldehyde dehydrogenase (NAD(P)+)